MLLHVSYYSETKLAISGDPRKATGRQQRDWDPEYTRNIVDTVQMVENKVGP